MNRPLYTRPRTGTGTTRQPQGNGTIRNTGSVSRGGNGGAITRQNGINDTYSDILGHNAGDDLLNQLLANLGIEQEKGLTGSQRDDWNKQLLDAQLQHYMDLEKRQYTADTLGEQRLYDSPMNQLARLMGAGISRDAAIAMLQGGQQATLAESAVSPTGLSASESKANGINNALGIASAVINGVSAVSGLVNLGFSIPQAIQQTQYLRNQNFLTGSQIKAYQSTGQAYSILKGINAGADAFKSLSSAVDAINDAAANGNTDAAAFIAKGGVEDMKQNAPFSSSTLGQLWRSERSSDDYATEFTTTMRNLEAEAALKEIQFDEVATEILNNSATFEEILSEIAVNQETARQMQLSNDITEGTYNAVDENTGKTGKELLIGKNIQELCRDFKILGYANTDETWRAQAKTILSDANKVNAINALLTWRNNADLETCLANPALFRTCCAVADCGIVDYANVIASGYYTESTAISGNVSGSIGTGAFSGSIGAGGSYSESRQYINDYVVTLLNRAGDASHAAEGTQPSNIYTFPEKAAEEKAKKRRKMSSPHYKTHDRGH